MSAFDSGKTSLKDLLNEIVDGKLQLPDFQRGWVWDDEHIRSLLISIARSFPIGAVMLLETGGEAHTGWPTTSHFADSSAQVGDSGHDPRCK